MRTIAFSLFAFVAVTAISLAGEVTITETLKQEKHAETQTEYFLIETAKPVSQGAEKTSKLQVAGLEQKAWNHA
ncbi:MAG TPA: hypothetical protein VNQ90_03770 [Chthoniobacteraceae bacterium]|nr:hypothetical protein [Chthoniobacteraceae bacterium]